MNQIAVKLLLGLSNLLGVSQYPVDTSIWKVQQTWSQSGGYNHTIISTKLSDLGCKSGSKLVFPSIIHSSHKISIDNRAIVFFGNNFDRGSFSFYGSPVVDCEVLVGKTLVWEIWNPTMYFSRIGIWPEVTEMTSPLRSEDVLNILIAGALLVFGIYIFLSTRNTSLHKVSKMLSGFSFSMAAFSLLAVIGYFNIRWSYFTCHKMGIAALVLASIFYSRFFLWKNLLNLKWAKIYLSGLCLILSGIAISQTGDEVQLMASLSFGLMGCMLWQVLLSLISKESASQIDRLSKVYSILGLCGFVLVTTFDIIGTVGLHSKGMFLPIGVLFSAFFMGQAIQLEVKATFFERDHLRENLEHEVERKTNELKVAQAELVQSAKLASLGTLSAGLAHEINNAVNYVNGALGPLEKLVLKNDVGTEKDKIQKLFGVMKEGLQLTVEIIKSLRNYSGLNQATLNDIKIKEVFNSVLAILRNKLRDRINIELAVPDTITVYGSVVGLNQVFMNIVSNAVDAMPNGGNLTISAEEDNNKIEIKIKDSGTGIPQDIKNRIFDPFFTTKDVGKGTGLGLYIVKKEIERHSGIVTVDSVQNQGTTFTINLPKQKTEGVAA